MLVKDIFSSPLRAIKPFYDSLGIAALLLCVNYESVKMCCQLDVIKLHNQLARRDNNSTANKEKGPPAYLPKIGLEECLVVYMVWGNFIAH